MPGDADGSQAEWSPVSGEPASILTMSATSMGRICCCRSIKFEYSRDANGTTVVPANLVATRSDGG
jgi:hypothetical protein